MLEESVLKRWSQVHLLSDEAEIDANGAHATAIFPDLRETMAHVQREVRDRLLSMMEQTAHPQPTPPSRSAAPHVAP